MSLWILGLLTIFALILGQSVRQRITFVSRLEDRGRLREVARAGIQKAVVFLKDGYQESQPFMTAAEKMMRHNNPQQFGPRALDRGEFEISFDSESGSSADQPQKIYGVQDEESKININKADPEILRNLIKNVLGWDNSQAQSLANAIRDWREFGESEATGFYSDEFYDNLKYPYPQKKSDFELLEELLLIKMMNKDIFERLTPFLTVYGDGKVNMNTASRMVLVSLGFSPGLTSKILSARRGKDGIEATADDYIFIYSYDFYSDLRQFFDLDEDETSQINALNARGLLGTGSSHYFIKSTARLSQGRSASISICLYSIKNDGIKYYREAFSTIP